MTGSKVVYNREMASMDQQISALPTEVLITLMTKINREICRRRDKDAITILKEWADKNREREVTYSFFFPKRGVVIGIILMVDERGGRNEHTHTEEDDTGTIELKKLVKHRLAEEAVRWIVEEK